MIGNDIVDLKYARLESDWKRPRFLDKIFTEKEQQLVLNGKNPELMVWLLWSMKESVYKIVSRKEGKRSYAPRRFACTTQIHSPLDYWGYVKYQNIFFHTHAQFFNRYIHTIAYETNADRAKISSFSIPSSPPQQQSRYIRQQLLTSFAQQTNIPLENLKVKKDLIGIPYIYYQNQPEPATISISHHGNYGGFAILIDHDE